MGRSVEDEEETKDAGIVGAAGATEGGGGEEEARLLRITSIRREEEVADEEFVENLKRQDDDDDDDDDSSRSNIITTSTSSSRCSSPREKEKEAGSRLWSKVKYQLVKFEALPEYLRDNEYIRGHYRLNWPLGPTLLSLFSFHNETLNIWTHFLGFLLFLGLTIFTVRKLPTYVEPCLEQLLQMPSYLHLPEEFASCLDPSCFSGTGSEDCSLKKHITRWPFFVFLGGAMFCLLSSTTCHLFSCISPHCSYLLLRLDYTGIALLIAGSFYPPVLDPSLSTSLTTVKSDSWKAMQFFLHLFS
jgi:adiponectin receptor